MHLADYQTPTTKFRAKEYSAEKLFESDTGRLGVTIRASGGPVSVVLGDDGSGPVSHFIAKDGELRLHDLYVGPFIVRPAAKASVVVTEIMVFNA